MKLSLYIILSCRIKVTNGSIKGFLQ